MLSAKYSQRAAEAANGTESKGPFTLRPSLDGVARGRLLSGVQRTISKPLIQT